MQHRDRHPADRSVPQPSANPQGVREQLIEHLAVLVVRSQRRRTLEILLPSTIPPASQDLFTDSQRE